LRDLQYALPAFSQFPCEKYICQTRKFDRCLDCILREGNLCIDIERSSVFLLWGNSTTTIKQTGYSVVMLFDGGNCGKEKGQG
jgi:hypothetical protein